MDRAAFGLLPSERVLWHDGPVAGVPRDRRWILGPLLLYSLSAVFCAFSGLLWVTGMEGAQENVLLSGLLALFATAVAVAPRYLVDPCEYLVTDRRVIWRRGRMRRSIERTGIHFGRIRWHRAVPGVGHLELVRAVPFGPLARRQRIVLHDLRAPDAVFALIRGAQAPKVAGDNELPLIERLEPGEQVLWGGHPEGMLIDWRELAIAALGVIIIGVALFYGDAVAGILLGLEDIGLSVRTWTWAFFFLAVGLTWLMILSVGVGLLWHGVWRARALGRATEYVLTPHRLLIRRGRTELSLDRRRIVDVAETKTARGFHTLFLMLDAPQSKALADSGALDTIPPPRDVVAPVLYGLREVEALKQLILQRDSRPSRPPVQDAA